MFKGSHSMMLRIYPLLLIASLLVICWLAYSLGLAGPYLLDDFHNLQMISVTGGIQSWQDLWRYAFGFDGLEYSRSIARLSFAVNDQYWPSPASGFKLTNVSLHLINGLLLILLLYKFLAKFISENQALALALLTVGFWLLHPLHVSTVLYVVQRMTQLMMLFLLLALLAYFFFRDARTTSASVTWLSVSGLCAVLSFLSKENAVIFLLLIPLMELILPKPRARLAGFLCRPIALIFSTLFVVAFAYVTIDSYSVYESRSFSLWERLAAQGQIVFGYWQVILLPWISSLGLHFDDVEWQMLWGSGRYSGWFWLLQLVVVWVLIAVSKKDRIIIFGLLWFYIGHVVESTTLPLEMRFEHRNYVPSVGLLLVAARFYLMAISRLQERLGKVGVGALVVLPLCLLLVVLAHRSALWSDYRVLTYKWAAEHPDSLRAQYSQLVMMENDGFHDKAVEEIYRLEEKFNDLTLPLYRLRVECVYADIESPKQPFDIALIEQSRFSSGVISAMKSLLAQDIEACVNTRLKNGTVGDLAEAIGKMPMLQNRPRYYAQYLDTIDEFYLAQGLFTQAVIARDKMWQAQPTVNTALKLAELQIMGGNYEEATRVLNWAKNKHAQLWFVDKQAENNILSLERQVAYLNGRSREKDD